jgi:hypothetical protein
MMRTHDGRINHLQCRVGQAAAGERLQHHIPDATVSPAAELPKNRIPVAELLRQIAPRRAGPHQPKRRVHHTAMVARRTASATDQKRFEIRPLIIGQQSANQGCPPQRAALNQFSIPASIDLSTRPSLEAAGNVPSALGRFLPVKRVQTSRSMLLGIADSSASMALCSEVGEVSSWPLRSTQLT